MTMSMLLHALLAALASVAAFSGAFGTAAVVDAGAAAAGGAPPPSTDPADAGTPSGDPAAPVEPADPAAVAAGGDGDDLSDDDPDDDAEVAEHLPEPVARTRLRRVQRLLSRSRPLLERLKGPGGKYLTPEEIDRHLANSREFANIDAVLSKSKRAVQVLLEEQERLARGDQGTAAGDDFPAFDEATWPFETDTPEGKKLLELGKELHETKRALHEMRRDVTGTKQERQQERLEQLNTRWRDATFKAAAELDEPYRPIFIRSVKREFERLQLRGELTKANAEDVINRELAELRAHKKTTTRSTTTRQSAAVARNSTLPAAVRPGAVQPAAAGATNKRETLKDASKGFLAKYRG